MTQPIYQERPRNDERPTRAKQSLFDRAKFVVIGAFFFFYFVWANISDDPLITVRDAISNQWQERRWLFWLLLLEVVRQCHYLMSERSEPWHQWWSKCSSVRPTGRRSGWTRG